MIRGNLRESVNTMQNLDILKKETRNNSGNASIVSINKSGVKIEILSSNNQTSDVTGTKMERSCSLSSVSTNENDNENISCDSEDINTAYQNRKERNSEKITHKDLQRQNASVGQKENRIVTYNGKNNYEFPLVTENSHHPIIITSLSDLLIGKWETILSECDALDPLFKNFGIGYLKRMIVDKLAIQIIIKKDREANQLSTELVLPIGNRHMKWDLNGNTLLENDPDCGIWHGHVILNKVNCKDYFAKDSKTNNILNDSVTKACMHDFHALTQIRQHDTIGIVHETRVIVPHSVYKKLLVLKYKLFSKDNKLMVTVMRVLRSV